MELNAYFVAIITALVLIGESIWGIVKRIRIRHIILVMAFTLYISILITITLFPLPLFSYPDQPVYSYPVNFIPFRDLITGLTHPDITESAAKSLALVYLGNILLFVPLGLFAPLLLNKKKWTFGNALVLGLITSMTVEFLQLIIGLHAGYLYRCVDIDDLILNTTGTVLGFALFRIIRMANPNKRLEK